MYGVHITFDNGHEPVIRFRMNRQQYSEEMLKWQIDYDLEIERAEEFFDRRHVDILQCL